MPLPCRRAPLKPEKVAINGLESVLGEVENAK
jgi:hypothetical protein